MVKQGSIKKVKQEDFDELYTKKIDDNNDNWSEIFSETVNQINNFSITNKFWFVADFKSNKVVHINGDYKNLSPFSKKKWLGLASANDMSELFHPADVGKMRSFIVYFANYIAQKPVKQRANIKVSMIFRMLDKGMSYTWRIMQYPNIHFNNNFPRFLLCLISNYNHLLNNPTCGMYILDENSDENTIYFCEEETVVLKPINEKNTLTKRELEVVKLLSQGLISKEIAGILGISKNTIENHKQNIFAKTKTKNIAELVGYAHKYILQNN
ncbi:MAG: helix-turn-helix transcriptional regulator [Bacteroidota bacterium]|nr:helix-turn-helix transcriptional regulator [Bacteroidota bacterium]